MTDHFAFFIADCFAWLIAGALLGSKLYPRTRRKSLLRKAGFVAVAIASSLTGGLFVTVDKGLPDTGFAFYNLFFSMWAMFVTLWIFYPEFRRRFY